MDFLLYDGQYEEYWNKKKDLVFLIFNIILLKINRTIRTVFI